MPRGEHRSSYLLSKEENEQVFSLIGPKCQSLATAVVQLFTTEGPGHSEWKKKDTGVLCLIKDNGRRSYFFRIYCLYRKSMIWEHEVYMQIEYKSPRPYLHTFEAEEYMTAFNFANEEEARVLKNVLIEKIETRKQKREERRQRSIAAARVNSGSALGNGTGSRHNGGLPHHAAPPPAPEPTPAPLPQPLKPTMPVSGGYTLKPSNKKPKARKLTKADIGVPLDFKHISHVGWDANKGFDVENLPEEEMRTFFSIAGISDSQLQDQATRQFIYDFINSHGGVDAVKEELHDSGKPNKLGGVGSASVQSPPPPPYGSAPPAPPVPARSPAPSHQPPAPPSRAPPPPPARGVPPPPPPPASLSRQPPPRPAQPPSSGPPSVPPPPPPSAPPPPPSAAPPPPPPPPAPPAPPAPPPAPALPSDSAVPMDARAALMESIRSGNKNLKKVETKPVEDSRSNLLSEIRQGIELRSVSRTPSNSTERRPAPSGLAGALARALADRNRAIHSDTDSDLSDRTTSDGEWDD